ncbi:MAG TPA: zf-TFIIB domain-containing protein [bacterium]|nr:zf-TFIIB domain-containing protein [bacterium]
MPVKPSDKEQEYFHELERQRIARLRAEHLQATQAAEREQRRQLHHLHCAKCGDQMTTTKLEGVDVEVCPECGGMYLDAGELDKLVQSKRNLFGDALAKLRAIWQ